MLKGDYSDNLLKIKELYRVNNLLLCKRLVLLALLVNIPFASAAVQDIYECKVSQVSILDTQGRQSPAEGLTKNVLLNTRFMVDRRTGVLTGTTISTYGYENKILADGKTLRNPLTVVSNYTRLEKDGANASYFLTVNTHVSGSAKTFFLKGMNGELMSGTCK
jgi:hypothetical protein